MAAQLALLREKRGGAVARTAPPSVLLSAQDAAREARADSAGAALNALEALSAGDAALPTLAAPLLLRDPRQDRTTLAPERESAVSRAVVVAAHRLIPVFPLRAAQRVIEWIVRALEAGRIGSDDEIDALLVAALPFHATPAFARLTTALLASPAPPRANWRWLTPVVEQGRPADNGFIATHISAYALHSAVRQLASAAVAGVAVAPLASFVASTVAARLLTAGRRSVETRTLALTCLEALCFRRKHFTVVSGARKKNEPPPPGVAQSMNRAKVAFIVALSVAVSGNVLDEEVRGAVLHAVISTVSASLSDQITREAAASCVIICLGRTDYAPMPPPLAKILSKWGGFPEALSTLTDTKGVHETFCSYLSALSLLAPLHKRARAHLMKGLSYECKQLLNEESVATVVCHLLDAYSPQEGVELEVEDKNFSIKERDLTDFLISVVRGQFTTAVDLALRRHFDKRRNKKKERNRYAVVNEALARAMSGTPYVTVKTSGVSDELEISEDTLLNCLEHPEAKVRLAGIERLRDERGLIEAAQGTPLAGALRGILMRRLTSDSDIPVVTEVLKSGLVPTYCDTKDALRAAGERYRNIFGALSEKKRKNLSSRLLNFSAAAFGFCVTAAAVSAELRPKVLALLVGLEAHNLLPTEAVEAAIVDDRDAGIMSFVCRKSADKPLSFVEGLCKCSLNADAVRILTALFSWDKLWAINCTKTAFESWKPEVANAPQVIATATGLIELMISSSPGNLHATEKALIVAISALKPLQKLDDSGLSALMKLWQVLSVYGNPLVIQEIVRVICITQGAQKLFNLLVEASAEQEALHVRAFSLQWSAALLKSGCVKSGAEILVRRLLLALYSSHQEIRGTAAGVCEQLGVEELGEYASKRAQLIFKKLKIAVSKPEVQMSQLQSQDTEEHWTAKHLQEQLLNTYPSLRTLPIPLAVANREKGTNFTSAIISIVGGTKQPSAVGEKWLSLLRCLEGVPFDFPEGALFVLKTVEKLLSGGQNIFASENRIEALLRVVVMMPLTSTSTESIDIVKITKLFILQSRALASSALSPGTALCGEAVLTGLLKCVTLLRRDNAEEAALKMSNDAVSTLFWLSTLSSPIGEFAVKLISTQTMTIVVQQDFERVTRYLATSVSSSATAKRRRTPDSDNPSSKMSDTSLPSLLRKDALRASVTGALEALVRLPTQRMKKSIGLWQAASILRDNMWSFVRSCAAVVKSNDSLSLLEYEYQLTLVLRILADFYRMRESKPVPLEPDDAMAAIDICFFPGTSSDAELSATARSLRASAAVLIESLPKFHSQTMVDHVGPFLRHVVSVDASKSNRECLSTILPPLIQGGLKIAAFLKHAVELNPCGSIKERLSVTDCIRICPNKKAATSAALNLLFTGILNESGQMKIMPECVRVLLHSGNSVDEILGVLARRQEKKLATLVVHILGSPEFILQLDANLHKISRQPKTDDAPKFAKLNEVFGSLFQRMLKSEDASRRNALEALLSIVPGSVICLCLNKAMSCSNMDHTLRALKSLIKRLDVNTPIHDYWEGEGASDASTETGRGFSESMCKILRTFIMSTFKYELSQSDNSNLVPMNPVLSDLGNHAMLALRKALMRSNRSHVEEVQRCGEALGHVMKVMLSRSNLVLLSSALKCLSETVKVLGKGGSVFVPPLSSAAVGVIEEALCEKASEDDSESDKHCLRPIGSLRSNPKQGMPMALEAAFHAIADILDAVPRMIGKNSLRRFAAVAAVSGSGTIASLLSSAMTKVSSTQALDALSFALKSAKSSPCDVANSVKVLMDGLVKATSKMRKSQVKSMKFDILNLCLSAMEYRGDFFTNQIGADHSDSGSSSSLCSALSSEDNFENCRKAEESCCSAVLAVVLKVPESDFKVMFNKIASWSESDDLQKRDVSILEKLSGDCPATIMRVIPMQRLCIQLFGVLRKIFCPYFAGVLERSLNVISTNKIPHPKVSADTRKPNVTGNGRKRRRETMEHVDEAAIAIGMEKMRDSAVRMCLQNVELFLRNSPDTDEISVASLTKIQDCILSSFDNYRELFNELETTICALASRMMITGTYRTKEQSRELIVSLSRAILLRTRSEAAAVRRGALQIVSSIVDTIHDEFLVALPEAMPILADVVDDERDDVAGVARDFVRKLEALTGEPILEQLK